MYNSLPSVGENNDSDAHCTALVDENHRYCWLWYKIEHYQLSMATEVVRLRTAYLSIGQNIA